MFMQSISHFHYILRDRWMAVRCNILVASTVYFASEQFLCLEVAECQTGFPMWPAIEKGHFYAK